MSKSLSAEVAEFLKNKRINKGLSMRKLSVLVYGDDKRSGYISQVERGEREITISTFGMFLTALDSWVEFIE
jgi:transcriptional regulator with XRE-family HTH domain